jgi:esterase/lipase superfamily enzyme
MELRLVERAGKQFLEFFDLSSREAGEILQKPQYQAATITFGWPWSGRQKSDN